MSKKYIQENQNLMKAFFNKSIEKLKENLEAVNSLEGREKRDKDYYGYTLALKAVIIMKEN